MVKFEEYETLLKTYKTIVRRDGQNSPKATQFRMFFLPHYASNGAALAIQQINRTNTKTNAEAARPPAARKMQRFQFPIQKQTPLGKPQPLEAESQPTQPTASESPRRRGRPKRNAVVAVDELPESDLPPTLIPLKGLPFGKWTDNQFEAARIWLNENVGDFSHKSQKQIYNAYTQSGDGDEE